MSLILGGIGPELPDPGTDRFWKIELVRNVDRNPIKVTLMENIVPGGKLGTALIHRRTVAVPRKIVETAESMLADAGEYATLVGTYGKEA